MELNEGLIIAQRFRLVRELGRGGMGSVWLAHHTSLDVPCAVKFIHAEAIDVPEIRSRFEREAKAAASLRSPNVVNILDYGVSEVGPYIAMEFLDGEDLAHRLERRGRLGPQETVEIVGNVARALTRAHAAGLVHRDLKPENVFLVHDEDREIVKVLDFGIAKVNRLASTDGATKTGSLLGTPSYMSPEQAQGIKAVDHRSDLWSLAVVAFRCLTGRLPFVSEALGDLLMQIIVNPLPVPSAIAPDLSPAFDAWWARAAARDPAQRFQTAREEAEALAAALGLAPVTLGGPKAPSGLDGGAREPPQTRQDLGRGPGQPGYATPAGGQPGYATPTGGQPGYATPTGGQPGHATPTAAQFAYSTPAGAQPGYATPAGAQPGAQGYGSGAYGAAAAFAGTSNGPAAQVAAQPTGGGAAAWGAAAGPAGSGPTGLGVSRTFGGPPAPAAKSTGRAAALVGGLAFILGVLIVGSVVVIRSRAAGGPAPAALASTMPGATTADAVASSAGSASAVPAAAPSDTAAPANSATPTATSASAANAAPPAPLATKRTGNGAGAKPAAPPTPSATTGRRPRLVLPGGKDPGLGF